jgi:hypothetical protein
LIRRVPDQLRKGRQTQGSCGCRDKKQNEGGRYKGSGRDTRKTLTTTCHSIDKSECGKPRQRDAAWFQWLPNGCSCQSGASREFAQRLLDSELLSHAEPVDSQSTEYSIWKNQRELIITYSPNTSICGESVSDGDIAIRSSVAVATL